MMAEEKKTKNRKRWAVAFFDAYASVD